MPLSDCFAGSRWWAICLCPQRKEPIPPQLEKCSPVALAYSHGSSWVLTRCSAASVRDGPHYFSVLVTAEKETGRVSEISAPEVPTQRWHCRFWSFTSRAKQITFVIIVLLSQRGRAALCCSTVTSSDWWRAEGMGWMGGWRWMKMEGERGAGFDGKEDRFSWGRQGWKLHKVQMCQQDDTVLYLF